MKKEQIAQTLRGKTILITGASGDIGLACATLFGERGATLILHSFRHPEAIREFRAAHPSVTVFPIRCNASDEPFVKAQFARLRKEFGLKQIDMVVNNAGDLIARRSMGDLKWDFIQKTIDVNVKSAFLFTKYSLPYLRANSSILFVSSLTARCGKGDRSSAYGLAKGALISWSKCLANELGPKKIRVNCLTPGFIEGSFHKKYTKQSVADAHARRNPLGRLGHPDDVARAALFFAENTAGYVSGVTLDICGADYMCS